MRAAAGAIVAAIAVALLFGILRHPQYTLDGIVYARFAARDAGYSERDATLKARAFYEPTSLMATPRYRDLIELDPSVSFARSKIFENRILYPEFVALLLPAFGFRALFIVSAISYIAFGLVLYCTLLAVARPLPAALFAALALILPLTRSTAASDLTDMLSMVWWTIALGALLRLARTTANVQLVVLALAALFLALTRPTPYLVALPALVLAIFRGTWLPFVASLTGVTAYAVVALATHAYGISEQLHWVYDRRSANDSNLSYREWYRHSLLGALRYAIVAGIRSLLPAIGGVLIVVGLLRSPSRAQFVVLAAAFVATLIAIPFNPVSSSIPRVVALPLIPVCLAAIAASLELVLERSQPVVATA